MEGMSKERLPEKILSRLRENVAHSEQFLKAEAMNPLEKKFDNLIQDVYGLIQRNGTSQEMKGSLSLLMDRLENIREYCRYYMNAAGRAADDYSTYLYALETLYNEYGKGAGETPKVANEVRAEKASNEAPAQKPKPQKKVSESTEVQTLTELDWKPATGMDYRDWWKQQKSKASHKEKSGRSKFAFP